MLKHVQISPLRSRSDSVSLRSSITSSSSCASSTCGSPEPISHHLQRTPSRASSYSSLNEQAPQTTIKIYTSCLKIDIEYKTLGIQWDTTSKELIAQLLRRLKMRHRDPRLFYLTMEVLVRRAGVKTVLVLDDETRPAILQACHPKGESRFCLQLKPGGLIRVHTSALQPTSQYKSLVISEETTTDELLHLLLSAYNSMEPVEEFSLYEVCPGQEYQRKLHPDDMPLRAQMERIKCGETCHFLVRRNPNYSRRRKLLNSLNGVVQAPSQAFIANSSMSLLEDDGHSLLEMSVDSLSDDLHSLLPSDEDVDVDVDVDEDENEDCASLLSGSSDTSSEGSSIHTMTSKKRGTADAGKTTTSQRPSNCTLQCQLPVQLTPSYNPVYNIREIRTVSHSFSSFGNDKKILDIKFRGEFDPSSAFIMRPQSLLLLDNNNCSNGSQRSTDNNGNILTISQQQTPKATATATATTTTTTTMAASAAIKSATTITTEAVRNHPAQGLGHFVYL